MRKTVPTIVLLAAVGLTTLTGCSGTAGGPMSSHAVSASGVAQTKAQACKVATDTVSTVQSDLAKVKDNLSSGDATKASDALTQLEGKLSDAQSKISNAKIDAAIGVLQQKLSDFGTKVAAAKDAGAQALAADLDKIQTAVATAGDDLNKVCS